MNRKEFFQQAMIAAMNGLLSANGNGYEIDSPQPYMSAAEMAFKYAEALTEKTFLNLDYFDEPVYFPERVD